MKPTIELAQTFAEFTLPPISLKKLGFCDESSPRGVAVWVNDLPSASAHTTSVRLYRALPEIVQLQTGPSERLAMLEAMRPAVHQCINGLSRSFLNQPVILPEAAMKSAVVAQSLQKHLIQGYLMTVRDWLMTSAEPEPKSLALALHRSLTGFGQQFLRFAQLYTPIPSRLWRQLYRLYGLAQDLELEAVSCADDELTRAQTLTLRDAFLRNLLLAMANPSQMRQQDLPLVYGALENWAGKVDLSTDPKPSAGIFCLDLESNVAPISSVRSVGLSSALMVDCRALLALIGNWYAGCDDEGLGIKGISAKDIYEHLLESWGGVWNRSGDREQRHVKLDVVVGMSAAHYHLSGHTLDAFMGIQKKSTNRRQFEAYKTGLFQTHQRLEETGDVWNYAFDSEKNTIHKSVDFRKDPAIKHRLTEEDERFPILHAVTRDISVVGYCLDWRDHVPANARVGEMVAIRQQLDGAWTLGVIRWMRQGKGSSQMGVVILAQQMEPIAAGRILAQGEVDMMRGMLIHEGAKGEQNLILPAMPFKSHDKIKVRDALGQERKARLDEQVYHCRSLSQFAFHFIDTGA